MVVKHVSYIKGGMQVKDIWKQDLEDRQIT